MDDTHQSPCKQWIDLLPPDVSTRIATHVSHGKQTSDALHLALSSVLQRDAVWTAISKQVCIKVDKPDAMEWARTFADCDLQVISELTNDQVEWLLCRMKTVTANVIATPRIFAMLPHSLCLKNLTLVIQTCTDVRRMANSVSMFRNLEELRFDLQHMVGVCINSRQVLLNLGVACVRIVGVCKKLRVLSWDSFKNWGNWAEFIFECLPAMTHVSVAGTIPPQVSPYLRKFHKLSCFNVPAQEAVVLQRSLDKLVMHFQYRSTVPPSLYKLTKCEQLTQLDLEIPFAACDALIGIIQSASALRELRVWWSSPGDGMGINMAVSVEQTRANVRALLEAACSAQNLTSLSMTNTYLAADDLEWFLSCMGRRLEMFGTKLDRFHELPLTRLCLLLVLLHRHNPNAHTLEWSSNWGSNWWHMCSVEARRVALLLLRRLQTSHPWFEGRNIEQFLNFDCAQSIEWPGPIRVERLGTRAYWI